VVWGLTDFNLPLCGRRVVLAVCPSFIRLTSYSYAKATAIGFWLAGFVVGVWTSGRADECIDVLETITIVRPTTKRQSSWAGLDIHTFVDIRRSVLCRRALACSPPRPVRMVNYSIALLDHVECEGGKEGSNNPNYNVLFFSYVSVSAAGIVTLV
jgi:hypothetical protein